MENYLMTDYTSYGIRSNGSNNISPVNRVLGKVTVVRKSPCAKRLISLQYLQILLHFPF